jgi:HAD superfamily hydrolase (TIGR01509 family)
LVAAARALLARARCVLFDFDGPLCRLFPQGSSRSVADALRRIVSDSGLVDLLSEAERTSKDPHLVLRAMHRVRWETDLHALGVKDGDLQDLVTRLERRLTEGEMAAALIAEPPSPDTTDFVSGLAGRGLRLAVVTNNSPRVADRYLELHGLRRHFRAVHGRTTDPGLMKPHPDVLRRALRSLGLQPADAVMIGDTDADVGAARGMGVRFIGYDMDPSQRAGAEVVIEAYAPLLGEVGERDARGSAARFVGEAARR